MAADQIKKQESGKYLVATCSDCYFRKEGLCALPGETPCPTFRAARKGALVPPRQPMLVPLRQLAASSAAA